MADILTFNEDLHEYRLNERKIPSVTQILSDLGFIDDSFFTLESRERGRKVHKITELYDYGSLDTETVDPRLKGYLDAWIAFCGQVGIIWTHIEHKMGSRFGYAGTCDRIGITGKGKRWLIDIKSSLYIPSWIEYQLTAYRCLAEESGIGNIDENISVHLSADGKYRVQEWEYSPNDWMAMLSVYSIKKRLSS